MFNRYRSRLRTKTTSIAASNPFVLDQISTPSAAAYSLRKLRGAYTGNAVRVRRTSDNTELDVGFASISQNLAVNGDFSNGGTGWTLSNASVASGVLNVSGGADFIKRNIGLVQGKKYWFSFDYTCSVGANLRVNNGNANGSSPVYMRNAINGTSGKIQGSFIATTTSGFFAIEADANTFTGTIDNIIVCEVGLAGNDLDLYAITQFCAPSGGSQSSVSSGLVSTWYDQSGFARHATQVTAGNQPRIVNAGVLVAYNSRPMMEFYLNPSDVFFGVQGTLDVGSVSIVIDNKSSTTFPNWSSIFFNTSPRRPMLYGVPATPQLGSDFPLSIWVNGSQGVSNPTFLTPPPADTPRVVHASLASTLTSNSALRIGKTDNNFEGRFGEFIILPLQLVTSERQNLDRDQGNYYGIAIA